VTRVRNSYLSKWYWKVKQRRGAKRALIGLARKILVIIYNLIKYGTDYDESAFEAVKAKQEQFSVKKVIAEARKLGLEVVEPQKTA